MESYDYILHKLQTSGPTDTHFRTFFAMKAKAK